MMESFDTEGESKMLKAIFLPHIIPSHLLSLVDIARVFAIHGTVDVTIIITPPNATTVQSSIDRDSSRGHSIRIHAFEFPQISEGQTILQEKFQQLLCDMKPDFVVVDMFFPWGVDVAVKLGIPSLIYMGGAYFTHCVMDSIERFAPHTKVDFDDESFSIPCLPHEFEMTCSQIPDWFKAPNEFTYLMKKVKESEKRSYGSLLKSFNEFEGPYVEHYKTTRGVKTWCLGPVSSWVNQDVAEKIGRGYAKEEQHEGRRKGEAWIAWLDSKKKDSVIYVCFGSAAKFPTIQFVEIAHGLEDSGHDFIWVVAKNDDGTRGFLEEFGKRVQESNKGYLIWGWAPQLVILDHPVIGAVMTHCGMNTIIESVDAGLPMVTWPIFAEQFFNERLVVDVLKIGVPARAKKWKNWNEFGDEVVKRGDIRNAIALLMGSGEKSIQIRRRVNALSDAAKKAIQNGGSSHNNLKEIIEELKSLKLQKVKVEPNSVT